VRETASRQPASFFARIASSMAGENRRSSFQLFAKPFWSGQTPDCQPASHAAPSAVASSTTGRSTGASSRSASRCMVQSDATMPPSTRSTASRIPGQSRRMASIRSAVW
jgi:hypothetical protein